MPFHHYAHAHRQLAVADRLDHVVVRAALEAFHNWASSAAAVTMMIGREDCLRISRQISKPLLYGRLTSRSENRLFPRAESVAPRLSDDAAPRKSTRH